MRTFAAASLALACVGVNAVSYDGMTGVYQGQASSNWNLTSVIGQVVEVLPSQSQTLVGFDLNLASISAGALTQPQVEIAIFGTVNFTNINNGTGPAFSNLIHQSSHAFTLAGPATLFQLQGSGGQPRFVFPSPVTLPSPTCGIQIAVSSINPFTGQRRLVTGPSYRVAFSANEALIGRNPVRIGTSGVLLVGADDPALAGPSWVGVPMDSFRRTIFVGGGGTLAVRLYNDSEQQAIHVTPVLAHVLDRLALAFCRLDIFNRASGQLVESSTIAMRPFDGTVFPWQPGSIPPGAYDIRVTPWGHTGVLYTNVQIPYRGPVFLRSRAHYPGDVNDDNEVGAADFSLFAAVYGSVLGSPNYTPRADFNLDGEVGAADFSLFAASYDREGT